MVGLAASAMGQAACREAQGSTIENGRQYTVYGVTLPVGEKNVAAMALIPKAQGEVSAVVFSFSTLVRTEPTGSVETMPAAVELAKEGKAAVVLERKLTWPEVDGSVGSMQQAVLCAQQWLAAHVNIKKKNWLFVGPSPDKPTFDQLKAAGDNGTMAFMWGLPVGGPNENTNTDRVLQRGSLDMLNFTKSMVGF